MTKEQLKELGLDDDKVTSVLNLFNESIKNKYIPITRFNEVNEAKKNAEDTVKTMTKQLDDLKKIDAEGLQQQIEALQKQNKDAATKYAADLEALKKNNAIEAALTSAKAKNITAVKALLSMDELTFEGDSLKGLDSQIKKLRESDDTKFLFEAEAPKNQEPNFSGLKPGTFNNNGNSGDEGRGSMFAQRYNAKMGVNSKKE